MSLGQLQCACLIEYCDIVSMSEKSSDFARIFAKVNFVCYLKRLLMNTEIAFLDEIAYFDSITRTWGRNVTRIF